MLKDLQKRPVINVDVWPVIRDQSFIEQDILKLDLGDERIILDKNNVVVDKWKGQGVQVS